MLLLPIIERELRVRARKPAMYWARFGVAGVAMLICLPAAAMGLAMGVNSGKYLFNAMVIAGFVLCSAACLLTSDAVSSERREGTLGLLLLTKAGDLDVLLGKFCSNGLTSLLALLALVPVFAIPVLGGGVTGTEILRKGLALGNALVFALAVGIYASAPESDRVRAARKAIFTSVLWNCVPLVALVGAAQGAKLLGLPAIFSPVLALACASDSTYQSAPYLFWLGLAGGQVASWFMVKRAAGELGRTLREEEVSVTPILSSTIPQLREPRIPELVDDEHGPVHWLVDRQRGVRAAIWAAALIGISANAGTIALLRFVGTGTGFMPYYSVPGFVTSILGGCLLAWAASRFFLDARRRGELELLLTTPEGSKNIVSGQWAALKGMIAGPLLVMMVPFVIQVLTYATRPVEQFRVLLPVLGGVGSRQHTAVRGDAMLGWNVVWPEEPGAGGDHPQDGRAGEIGALYRRGCGANDPDPFNGVRRGPRDVQFLPVLLPGTANRDGARLRGTHCVCAEIPRPRVDGGRAHAIFAAACRPGSLPMLILIVIVILIVIHPNLPKQTSRSFHNPKAK